MTRITHQFIEACKAGHFQRMEWLHRNMPCGYYPSDFFVEAMLGALSHGHEDIFTYLVERHHTILCFNYWNFLFSTSIQNKRHSMFFTLEKYGKHHLHIAENDNLWYEAMLNHDYLVLTHLFNKGYYNIRHPNVLETASLYSDLTKIALK